MTPPLEQSIETLLRASHKDESALLLPLDDMHFGYCAQQAAEKLLKVIIGANNERYAFTHDLGALIKQAERLGENLPSTAVALEKLTDYAGIWRYTESDVLDDLRRVEIRGQGADLRLYVVGRLEVLGAGIDWQKKLSARG